MFRHRILSRMRTNMVCVITGWETWPLSCNHLRIPSSAASPRLHPGICSVIVYAYGHAYGIGTSQIAGLVYDEQFAPVYGRKVGSSRRR